MKVSILKEEGHELALRGMMVGLMKTCTRCNCEKPKEEFRVKSDRPHLRFSTCRACEREKSLSSIKKESIRISCEMHFSEILTDWVSRHARKPMQIGKRYERRVAGSQYIELTHEHGEDAEIVIFESDPVSRITRPLFGHLTGVKYEV